MSRPTRLLLLSTAGTIGGTERVVLSLARQFSARGADVRAIFPQSANAGPLIAWARDEGVDAETDPRLLPMATVRGARDIVRLRALVRSWKPDVVNLHYGGNHISIKDVIAVRLAGRARCVASVHHPTPWREAGMNKRRMTRMATKLCAAVVVQSRAMRDVLLEAGVDRAKIRLVPLGVRPPAVTAERGAARERLGLPSGAFIVGALGRLVPEKGVQDLVTAFGSVPVSGSEMLVIAGEGPERGALEVDAAPLGSRVRFLGAVPSTDDFYAAIDVFALPSYNEGFGIVFVEAAFHGVPSIAANVGGVPDAIADGITGLLVPVGDHDAIAAAIVRLRDDAPFRRSLGEAARTRARREFAEELMADRYADAYGLPSSSVPAAVVEETASPA